MADASAAPAVDQPMEADQPVQPQISEQQQQGQDRTIATEGDLESFARLPLQDRSLDDGLRGVLAETATSGLIRYNWLLLRPLLEFAMEQVLRDYDARATADSIGPPRPAFANESLDDTVERFKGYMGRFTQAPWTVQRLCEVLLAPQKQYTKLHKVAMAIEKCLLVTSEVASPSPDLPPLPRLSQLHHVNENPAVVLAGVAGAAARGAAAMDTDEAGAFTSTLLDVRQGAGAPSAAPAPHVVTAQAPHPPHTRTASGPHQDVSHIEEDHWPDLESAGAHHGMPPLHLGHGTHPGAGAAVVGPAGAAVAGAHHAGSPGAGSPRAAGSPHNPLSPTMSPTHTPHAVQHQQHEASPPAAAPAAQQQPSGSGSPPAADAAQPAAGSGGEAEADPAAAAAAAAAAVAAGMPLQVVPGTPPPGSKPEDGQGGSEGGDPMASD